MAEKNIKKNKKKLSFFPNDILQQKNKHKGISDVLKLEGCVLVAICNFNKLKMFIKIGFFQSEYYVFNFKLVSLKNKKIKLYELFYYLLNSFALEIKTQRSKNKKAKYCGLTFQ